MKPRLALLLSAVFLLIVSAVIFAPALFGGKMLVGGDIDSLVLPLIIAARRSLAAGEWPFWMPEILGGMPGMAAATLIFLYPSEILINLLKIPVTQGPALDAALQIFLSGLGMLFFLRRLGLSFAASLLGALFYSLSGTQTSLLYAGHTNNIKAYAMIPWAFWGAHKGFTEKSLFAWGLCGLAFALQILGIGMQIFAYTIIGVGAYAGWMAWKETPHAWKRALLGFAVSIVFAVLLSAPQLWLTFEYRGQSWREGFSYADFTSWSFHPKEALGWVVPGFFGWREPTYHGDWPFSLTTEYFGLLPWALGFAALTAGWREKKGMGRFFIFLALVSFLIGMGKYTPLHQVFYKLPLYSGFRVWARFLCLLTFSVCVLGALGWDALWAGERRKTALKGVLVFCGLALVLAFASMALNAPSKPGASELAGASAVRALVFTILIAGFCWSASRQLALGLGLVAALGLHIYDSSDHLARFIEFKSPAQFGQRPQLLSALPQPGTPEPWRLVALPGFWNQNESVIHGYEDIFGYHGVQLAGPMKLQKAMEGRQLDWLSMLNVNFILSASPIAGLPLLLDGDKKIYRNPMALPRAWLVAKSRRVESDEAAYQALADPAFSPRNEVILLKDTALAGGAAKGSVRWTKRGRNAFELEVEALQDSALVVSNFWYPSWKCKIDGKPAKIMKANAALQAVTFGPGKHQIRFYFDSTLFYAACMAFFLGIAGLFGLLRIDKLGYIQY